MKASTAELERQARVILGSVEGGVEVIDRYGRPWVQRYLVTIVGLGVAGIVALGAMVAIVGRRRRRRTLAGRLHEARSSMSDRLERPISTIRSAAERIAH